MQPSSSCMYTTCTYMILDDPATTRVSTSSVRHLQIYILTFAMTEKIIIWMRTDLCKKTKTNPKQNMTARADNYNAWSFYFPKCVWWKHKRTSRAMLLRASSSAEKRSFRGALFLPVPWVPMMCPTAALSRS